jgi:cytochrome o ubiquinol oxidase subunit 1
MPRNSAAGFVAAFFAVMIGFALIWHIWWLALLGVLGALVTILASAWRLDDEEEIPAAEVARLEASHGPRLEQGA